MIAQRRERTSAHHGAQSLLLLATTYDLGPGSPERAALLDLARPTVESELGTPVTFLVKALEQESGRVLAWLVPRR
jgi:hypothetical protein